MAYTYTRRTNTNSKHSPGFPGGSPFSKNPSTGGNCTWWAWGRFKEVYKLATGKSLSWTAGSGNACMFYTIMGKAGYKTGKNPKPGAIICWGYGSSHGNPGHVAFVEQVYSNGDIEISQSGWSSGPIANKRITKKGGYHCGYNNDVFNGFIYNKVEFTNPNGSTYTGGGGDHPQSWYIKKYGTGAQVYFELKGYGYSHKACCAVLGNMEQESGIRVYTKGSYDGNGSEGLCQWTFSRKTAMQKYAAAHSKTNTWKSVDGQVAFLVYELQNSEKSANKVLKNDSYDLETMTKEFEKKFERAGVPNFPARVKYAKKWDQRMSGSGDADADGFSDTTGSVMDMQLRSSQLYSSEDYDWLAAKAEEETESQKNLKAQQKAIKDFLKNIKIDNLDSGTVAIPDYININPSTKAKKERTTNSTFSIGSAMVETPFVEIDFGGTVIGTYNNSVDEFPNHISNLEIEKTNGEINKYTFTLIHQIRPGEDPNLLDKIISKVRYNTIKIKYGDYSSNVAFGDEKAIITNVSQNRDYANNRIVYTIFATSAGSLITSYKINFKSTIDKPSNVINSLLYENPETSSLLLSAFPGMKNRSLVSSNNLIPSNDTPLDIDEKYNIDTIEYINYLVSCMSNVSNATANLIRKSLYYISYENDYENKLGGAFFNIKEIVTNNIIGNNNNIFEVTVGYPDNNYVMGFSVDNDIAWSLLYENAAISDEYVYSINNRGEKVKNYSPNLISSSSIMNEIQKNWWTKMVNFPINASLTLKGFMKPVMLMNYVNVNVVFYGQKHITSGLYVITGQKDSLSGEGFRTTLALTRIGDN